MIEENAEPNRHWNFFIALEQDLETLSRYIEFTPSNYKTYSIELARLFLSASSEVDVVLKQLCLQIDGSTSINNMGDYREFVRTAVSEMVTEKVRIDRFGLEFCPWENWIKDENPNWWRSHNNVKHHRDEYFDEANLQNTLNAVGGLLISNVYYYSRILSGDAEDPLDFKDTNNRLAPQSSLLKMNPEYYVENLTAWKF